jgi:Plant transposon protein
MFSRCCLMTRAVFDRIYKDFSSGPEFVRRFKAIGKPGLHPLQRVVAVLRKISYGLGSDAVDECVRISESSVHESLFMFCRAICELYGAGYGRQPTEDDLRRILKINSNRGIPGCVGSIDCQHCSWEAVRSSLRAILKERRKIRQLVSVITRQFRLFLPLISTPAPSARFRILTVGRGWHRRSVFDPLINSDFALLPNPAPAYLIR